MPRCEAWRWQFSIPSVLQLSSVFRTSRNCMWSIRGKYDSREWGMLISVSIDPKSVHLTVRGFMADSASWKCSQNFSYIHLRFKFSLFNLNLLYFLLVASCLFHFFLLQKIVTKTFSSTIIIFINSKHK